MDSGFLKITLVYLMICCISYGHGGACKKCQQITTYVNGHRVCSCQPGYVISSSDRSQCVDINECEDSVTNPCGQICSNTEGSYVCSCEPGYVLNSADNATCYDTNECQQTPSPCDQICTNTNGSYSCSCKPGFALNNTDNATCSSICASYDSLETEVISSYITKKECFDKCAADPFCFNIYYDGTDECTLYKASGNLTDFEKDQHGWKYVTCPKNIASNCLPFSDKMTTITADKTFKDCFNSCSKTQNCYAYSLNDENMCVIVTPTGTVALNVDDPGVVIIAC